MALFYILRDIIVPVFILMTLGFVLQRKFTMDLGTLAKLNIYFFVPGFIFVTLYESDVSPALFGAVTGFFFLFVFLLFFVSAFTARLLGLETAKKTTFTNSALFFNSGNYGVPVNDLVFRGDPYAMSIQVVVLTLQNMFLFSYGILTMRAAGEGRLRALAGYLKMPVLYAMLLGIGMNLLELPVAHYVWVPVNYVADGMIAIALLTLGAQVARISWSTGLGTIYASLAVRLVVGPVLALGLILLFRLDGTTAQALLIASAMPTSVNSAVIAQEYNNHPDFAAKIVLFSTLCSAFTVTVVIYAARVLFG
ncbi:AEC family transporter [Alkalicoccus chagannorensis]|uniref:AEC family transporter n=1 Tax=Alkalicoccus chagannorensis TaxID=427072 RepID=UPI00054E8FB6|nr:AEC family transporter [Alkalicoccus chagannorensis]